MVLFLLLIDSVKTKAPILLYNSIFVFEGIAPKLIFNNPLVGFGLITTLPVIKLSLIPTLVLIAIKVPVPDVNGEITPEASD